MDQSYEQLKKSIKGEGGAVGLTENLKKLSRIVAEFEDTVCDVSESVMSAKQLGIKQYNAFITDRIVSNSNTAIANTITKITLLYLYPCYVTL